MAAAPFRETRAIFFPDGHPPPAGAVLRQPDLARTLRTLQAEGPSAFYRGGIADAIVAASDRAGGLFSQRDFAEHRTEILEPIGTTYRSWTVLEQPPVSQGLILLIALNILESAGVPSDPVDRVHFQVEAHKLALRERLSRVGDPRVSPTDLGPLLSKAHAASLAGRIDQPGGSGTRPRDQRGGIGGRRRHHQGVDRTSAVVESRCHSGARSGLL